MKIFRGKLLSAKKFLPDPVQATPEHWSVVTIPAVLAESGVDFHASLPKFPQVPLHTVCDHAILCRIGVVSRFAYGFGRDPREKPAKKT